MKKLIFIFLTSTFFGALPPLAQSTRELKALLADTRLHEFLGSAEQIKEIIRTEKGYLILTQSYAMRIDITYGGRDSKIIGPIQFEFDFHEPIDL